MSNPKRNTESPNKGAKPNNAPSPKTQAEFYAHAWTTILNKLSKEERESLLINLQKPDLVVRGVTTMRDDVNRFVKNVAALGEEMFEKSSKVVNVAG